MSRVTQRTALLVGGLAVALVVVLVAAVALVRPWEKDATAGEGGIIETAIAYKSDPSVTDDDLTGYLYRPTQPDSDGDVPVIVMIHGGGWLKGPDAKYVAPAAARLAEHGFVVWSVNYRRVGDGGGWPTTFEDLGAAVDYVAELRNTVPGIDLDRVTVVGHSAGGQLAAWTARRETLPADAPGAKPVVKPHAVVSLAGVLDMQLSLSKNDHVKRLLGGLPEQYPERYALVDPLEHVDPTTPVVAVTGTADSVVPPKEAAEFVAELRAKGGMAALVEIPATEHGEIIDVKNPWWPTVASVITTMAELGPQALHRR